MSSVFENIIFFLFCIDYRILFIYIFIIQRLLNFYFFTNMHNEKIFFYAYFGSPIY